MPNLSPRERRLLFQIAQGKTSVEIAESMHVSRSSVHTYVHRAYAKLGAKNAAHAVYLWILGYAQPEGGSIDVPCMSE